MPSVFLNIAIAMTFPAGLGHTRSFIVGVLYISERGTRSVKIWGKIPSQLRKDTPLSAIRNTWGKTLATREVFLGIELAEESKREVLKDLMSFYVNWVYIDDLFRKEEIPSFEEACVSLSERCSSETTKHWLNGLVEKCRLMDKALEAGFEKTLQEDPWLSYVYRQTLRGMSLFILPEFREAGIPARGVADVRNSYGNRYRIISLSEEGIREVHRKRRELD